MELINIQIKQFILYEKYAEQDDQSVNIYENRDIINKDIDKAIYYMKSVEQEH